MSRRVRRDSETSTDSWSLVEEDRLDDDFSLNSTDNEGAELDAEPIVEEPPTSDEEDTASEKSLGSDSEDSDSDSDDSELSDASEDDVSEVSEGEEEEEVEEAIQEDSEDSDLSDAESDGSEALEAPENSDEESEESEDEEEEDEELSEVEMNDEEIAEAARKLKEDEKWFDEELPESVAESGMRAFRALLICTLFFLLFPLADVFTSWMLTIKGDHHQIRALIQEIDNQILTNTNFANVLTLDSLQSYPEEKMSWKDDIDSDVLPPNSMQRQTWKDEIPEKDARWVQMMRLGGRKRNLNLLQDILEKKPEPSHFVVKESEIMDILNVSSNDWKRQTDAPMTSRSQKVDLPWAKRRTPRSNDFKMPIYQPSLSSNLTWFSRIPSRSYRKPAATCSALAPVPPAPFTPRRIPKRHLPRHQPCFVHVNQSKWTCQKNWPSVVYQEPKFTVMPRVYKKKGMGRTGEKRKGEEIKLSDVCAKKASQSMRKIPRPTDQCAGWLRHERQSIGYKAPLPCKVPTYKPTIPKKSYKPSTTPNDDWHHKRSEHRAQLRSRA